MRIPVRHEPTNMQELRRNAEVFAIFTVVGWTDFFQRLSSFHQEKVLLFSLNIIETHPEVSGLHIEFTKEIVAEFMDLPQIGRAWFGRRV